MTPYLCQLCDAEAPWLWAEHRICRHCLKNALVHLNQVYQERRPSGLPTYDALNRFLAEQIAIRTGVSGV